MVRRLLQPADPPAPAARSAQSVYRRELPAPTTLFAQGMSNDEADGFSSFDSTSASGATLTGGVYSATTYDSGALTVTVDGFQASASYNQNLNNTPQLLASALAAALNASSSPVTAQANGAGVTITAKIVGSAGEYSVTGGSSTSFTASSATLGNDANPGGLFTPYVTLYQYDALGDLLRVDQKGSAPTNNSQWRTRTFTYDSLGRLLSAHNPESGTISYLYDNDGNLLMKTSPAPNQIGSATQSISFCYDELNRVTKKDYTAHTFSPPACPSLLRWSATLTMWARTAKAI